MARFTFELVCDAGLMVGSWGLFEAACAAGVVHMEGSRQVWVGCLLWLYLVLSRLLRVGTLALFGRVWEWVAEPSRPGAGSEPVT